MMGIFGWSLPPGCSTLPGEEQDGPCDVCGKELDDCICPECGECGDIGNPTCYVEHGLFKSQEQIDSLAEAEARWKANAKSWDEYAEYWDAYEMRIESYL
jgi:hypothetical protein